MRVAIVYDRVNKWGGAERVLLTLHEMFPDAPLYTSVYDPVGAPWAKDFPKVHTSFLQKIKIARRNHEYLAPLMPLVFEIHDFSNYDLVISVTSEFAKGIITGPKTKHICYMLTPTRYLWSHEDEYFKDMKLKKISKPVVSYLKKWDKAAAHRPDVIVSISSEVRDRVRKYYDRESKIIFPPVNSFQISKKNRSFGPRKGVASRSFFRNLNGCYLLVSRLVKYKKVDLAIEVFNELQLPLYVVGSGREERKLKNMAKGNIKFLGKLTDEELFTYYKGARALVFPQEEDFGIVSVEAQGVGTPVIAFGRGGAKDTVVDNVTGIFFEKQSRESLKEAIKRFDKMKFDRKRIVKNAKRFSKARFKKEFMEVIKT